MKRSPVERGIRVENLEIDTLGKYHRRSIDFAKVTAFKMDPVQQMFE